MLAMVKFPVKLAIMIIKKKQKCGYPYFVLRCTDIIIRNWNPRIFRPKSFPLSWRIETGQFQFYRHFSSVYISGSGVYIIDVPSFTQEVVVPLA